MAPMIISRLDAKAQGLKTYATGRPCGKGHVAERWVVDRSCVACGRAYSNAWKERNRERSRKITREWKVANPGRSQAVWRRYYANNQPRMVERTIIQRHTRRAQKKGSGGTHTAADLAALLMAQKHRCAHPGCGADLRKVGKHLDHVMPLSRGGSNDRRNLQYLCPPHNLSKGGKDPLDFAREQGRLL